MFVRLRCNFHGCKVKVKFQGQSDVILKLPCALKFVIVGPLYIEMGSKYMFSNFPLLADKGNLGAHSY